MRKSVPPRTDSTALPAGGPAATASSRRTSCFGDWLEGLEARRMLAATPLRLGHPGLAMGQSARLATISTSNTSVAAAPTVQNDVVAPALVAPIPQTYSGALNGKIVFTSGGHGWQWNTTLNRYATDRGDNFEIVEDFGNQEQMSFYADYALRAGATVVPMRPVGHQPNEVVLDNDSPGVTFGTGWSNSASSVHYDEDYGTAGGGNADAVAYRFRATSTTETAVATYQPIIAQAGFYPVYTWALSGTNRTDQLYRINHTGGSTEVRVDHRKVGRGWVYLGTYHFDAGSNANGNVQISNQSAVAGQVIADAIRFGNGMGDYVDSPAPGVSGYTREDENSLAWIARSIGVGTSLSSAIGAGASNVSAPSNFAQWMNSDTNPFGTSVYIGFHSNAGGGRGAVGLIDSDQGTPNQSSLALYTGRQINQDMQALNGQFEHDWSTRTTHTYTSGFGEIDLGAGAEMDATIIEVAFHDSQLDAELMRDPKVRAQLAKSTLDATLEYFDRVDATTVQVSAPSAPVSPRAAVSAAGDVMLSWSAGPTGARGGAASGYRVYVSRDGKGFGKLADVATTSFTIPATDLDGGAYYFRVAAVNAGGESPTSYAVGARRNGAGGGGGTNRILIVNGFDRFDRGGNVRGPYAFTGDRLTDRVRPLLNNTFDYVTAAGEAIEAYTTGGAALGFDSVQNEHVTAALLGQYRTVVWLAGEESTDDESFSDTEQSAVSNFISNGGSLFVSGSEIGWDLDRPSGPTAGDRSFFNNTLKADYVSDDANSYSANPVAQSIFAGMPSLSFDTRDIVYDADFADVLAATGGSTAALTYGTGGVAATQWATAAAATGARVVNMAFPFETITTDARRNDVMSRVLNFFQTAVSDTPNAPDLLATSDSGFSNGDNITNLDNSSDAKRLQFLVSGNVPGSTLTLYADGVLIGRAINVGPTATITTTGTTDLLDGTRSITVRQQTSGKELSAPSAPLGIIVDTVRPTVDFLDVDPDPRTTGVDSIVIAFDEPVAGFTASDLYLQRSGVTANLLNAGHTLTSSDDQTFTLNNLAAVTSPSGTYTLRFGVSSAAPVHDLAGNSVIGSSTTADTWVNDNPLPVVTGVFVNGISWSESFRNFLATSGEGDATFGYRLDAADHANELPWTNIDQVSIRFSEHVNLAAQDLSIWGVNVPSYGRTLTYDPNTFTATWTLLGGTVFRHDKILLDLDAASVSDANGNALDGEWTNPAETTPVTSGGADTFPSGNGTAGGDFRFRLNVLPGDVNGSGSILGTDVTLVRNAQGSAPGFGLYTIFKDVNATGSILGTDVTLVRNRQGLRLPDGEPGGLGADEPEDPLVP